MSKTKLKPCPWCGNAADYTVMYLNNIAVSCDSCGSQGPWEDNAKQAKTSWNTRDGQSINDQLLCLYEIRCILGDPTGRLMQSEVVERVRGLVNHFRDATKKAKGGKR